MGQYNKAVLTTAGENLITRALAGEIKLNITKAKTSSYAYPSGTDLKSLTDMQGIKQTAADPATAVYDDTMIQTRVLFSNEEIVSTYYIHNIGLYAMDGTQEVLFCIVTAETPDEMPRYNGVASTSYIYNIQNVVQDAAELHIVVYPSGTATIQDVLERVDATGGDISETVIETLDTIEDKYPVPAAGESVKRFLGKVLTFLKSIRPLTGDITLYISANTGSDITGDGSESNPFASIGKALYTIPKDLHGFTASIYVSDGIYAENVNINGIKNGSLILRRNGIEELNSLCNVNKITAGFCDSVSILGINLIAENTDSTYFNNCEFVYVNCCQSIATAPNNQSFSFDYVSVARVTGCRSINHQNCLRSYSSYIFSGNWSGDSLGNMYGIYVDGGGHVATGNVYQPTGTILNEYYTGGSLITGVFGAKIGTLKSDTTLYIATTGSDTLGNGTQANPFKTIQHAINILPKDLNGYTATIIISGGTYDEDLLISGFGTSGVLMFLLSGNITVRSVTTKGTYVIFNSTDLNSRKLTMQYLLITDGSKFNAYSSIYITTTGYMQDGGVKYSIYIMKQSYAYISGITTLSGNTETALCLTNMSNAYFYSIAGSGFNVGISIFTFSQLSYYSENIIATTHIQKGTGGMIINSNGTQISNIISYGLACTWGTISGGYRRIGNYNNSGPAQIVVTVRIQLTTTLNADTEYIVSGFPIPADTSTSTISCSVSEPSTSRLCYVSNSGLHYMSGVNRGPGNALHFNCTYITNS